MTDTEKLEKLLNANLEIGGQLHLLQFFYEKDKTIIKSLSSIELKLLEAILPLLDEKENLSDNDKKQLKELHKRYKNLNK